MPGGMIILLALLLDRCLGEPCRWHPLVGFGSLVGYTEQFMYGPVSLPDFMRRLHGLAALIVLVVPFVLLVACLEMLPYMAVIIPTLVLYFALGLRSLVEHADAVAIALEDSDLGRARECVGRMVSRDTRDLDETQVASAACESVLENGCDAVFGALFWFAVFGAPGALCYRLVNTLDAMWGYSTDRYQAFGWAVARCDDVLGFIPARLTALTYAVMGGSRDAIRSWRTQAHHYDSPNAGPVMAAGAGALALRLGGDAIYHGKSKSRAVLGSGSKPTGMDIRRATRLVEQGVLLWLAVAVLLVFGERFYA